MIDMIKVRDNSGTEYGTMYLYPNGLFFVRVPGSTLDNSYLWFNNPKQAWMFAVKEYRRVQEYKQQEDIKRINKRRSKQYGY